MISPLFIILDGTEPTVASPLYEGVLKVKENATLSAKAIRPLGDSKVLTEKIDFSKSSMKPIVANQKINEQYMFKGAATLIDGLKAVSYTHLKDIIFLPYFTFSIIFHG